MKNATTKRGRPAVYTRERIKRILTLAKQGGRSLKAVLKSLNAKNGTNLKYVPLLVAMAREKMNVRRK